MKIYLVTWTEMAQGRILNEMEVENRLLSYFFLQNSPDEWLESYFKNGIGKGKERKSKEEKIEDGIIY